VNPQDRELGLDELIARTRRTVTSAYVISRARSSYDVSRRFSRRKLLSFRATSQRENLYRYFHP
jgi:hypothetical protein